MSQLWWTKICGAFKPFQEGSSSRKFGNCNVWYKHKHCITGDLWAATLAVRTIQLWMQWCVQATQRWANSLELYTKLGRRKGHSIMVNEGPQIFHLTWLANSKAREPIPKSQIWSDPTNQFKRIPTIWWLTQMNPYLDSKFTRTRQQLNLSGIGVAGQLKNMLPFVSNQQTWQKSMHNIY